jgi:hypothetical protein
LLQLARAGKINLTVSEAILDNAKNVRNWLGQIGRPGRQEVFEPDVRRLSTQ